MMVSVLQLNCCFICFRCLLFQVLVTSVSQFHNFYGGGTNPRKSIQKAVTEIPKRSHKGLIVYVSSHGGEKLDVSVSKLNFVDLAG